MSDMQIDPFDDDPMTWESYTPPELSLPQIEPMRFNVVAVVYVQGDNRVHVYQSTGQSADGSPIWNEIDRVPPNMHPIDIGALFADRDL